MTRIALALCCFAFCAPARADEAAPPPEAPKESAIAQAIVQAWGRAHPECAEWSDACVVCTQEGCSTPGVACMPREIVCRRP